MGIFVFASLWGCERNAFEVDPPSYITIDSFMVSDTCFSESASRMKIISHKISDAWVLIDGEHQGSYELPARFPVTTSGVHSIEIRPGIKKSGISALRAVYPFYEFYKGAVLLTAENSTVITPCVSYRLTGQQAGQITVAWKEDFESVVDLTYNDNSDTTVVTVSGEGEVFEGNFSGAIFMTENDYLFELISPTFTSLPKNGTPIYLELNYRSNHDFFVGLYSYSLSQQENLYGFKAKESWNKIYIDLTDPIRFTGNSGNFNIFIGFIKNPDIETVSMYIDNIKLLHF